MSENHALPLYYNPDETSSAPRSSSFFASLNTKLRAFYRSLVNIGPWYLGLSVSSLTVILLIILAVCGVFTINIPKLAFGPVRQRAIREISRRIMGDMLWNSINLLRRV
ncbi:hypothetical protein EJ05DRAFT_480422 [Pseudovirgaria hyperparasitica]|uniref:Uncharacterized protein n=1 Tax=Pseudovirgaria hyperparasitica TaxID=470096 RepID=A0A6A6VRU7_9PEZI|nr:uncharacterized protein EJ05DRAFT_480422 [Pseudovirgaria hyperparasitica]KAF2753408.1 hypothetical protein EJ05DRAFT_480422 [Pseudovirgaria hyperparasitica]